MSTRQQRDREDQVRFELESAIERLMKARRDGKRGDIDRAREEVRRLLAAFTVVTQSERMSAAQNIE